MYGLVSVALIYAVVFLPTTTHHFTIAAHVTASTTRTSSPTNEPELLEPEKLSINTEKSVVSGKSIHPPAHPPHRCCHNKTTQPNQPTTPTHSENPTRKKYKQLQLPHEPENKSKVQLETIAFINAEKEVPQDEVLKTSNVRAEDSTLIVPSNENNATTEGAPANSDVVSSSLQPFKIVSNLTESVKTINPDVGGEEESSWTKSPFLRSAVKYLITEFYPEKLLNSLSNRLIVSNRSNVEVSVDPSIVYPLVMEGVSLLLNQFAENASNENTIEDEQGVVKGRIANIMLDSIDKLLRNKFLSNDEGRPVEGGELNNSYASEKANIIPGLMNLDAMKSFMPLIQTVQSNDELSNIVATFLAKPPNELGDLDLNSLLRDYGSQFSGILSNARVLNAISQSSNQTDALNFTSIMEQFLPKDDGAIGSGISPKNPLLRSEFVTKVLSKSPVAHLGALDDSIKKLVTSSLEKAVSRVKIDQNGQIQMSDGMKRMVSKMLQSSDPNMLSSSAMDSINGVLKSIVHMSSGSDNVTEDAPMTRRNVTKHSHLHRRFQEKYGKDPRVPRSKNGSSPSSQASLYFAVLMIPLALYSRPVQ